MKIMMDFSVKEQKQWMLLNLIKIYYQTDSAGGCYHAVLDDGNYEDGSVRHCLEYSLQNKDYWGETIAKLLLEFSEEERKQLIDSSWEVQEKLDLYV